MTFEGKAPEGFGYLEGWVLLKGGRDRVKFQPEGAKRIQGDTARLVDLPSELRMIFPAGRGPARIVFLTREALVEHDMAVLQAPTLAALATLTDRVLVDSVNGCNVARPSWCAWVPKGVAIRVEKPSDVKGADEWVPVL